MKITVLAQTTGVKMAGAVQSAGVVATGVAAREGGVAGFVIKHPRVAGRRRRHMSMTMAAAPAAPSSSTPVTALAGRTAASQSGTT